MGDRTGIEWADATWNPTAGCSVVSPGCTNCYAMRVAGGRGKHLPKYAGLTRPSAAGPVWTGEVRVDEAALPWPLTKRRPRVIFVDSMSDLFHPAVTDETIERVFAVMAIAWWHRFIVLTKRPNRMQARLSAPGVAARVWGRASDMKGTLAALAAGRAGSGGEHPWPLRNVAAGVSAEDQRRAEERIPLLLETPAAVRIVSLEPLLGPVDLGSMDVDGDSYVTPLQAASPEELTQQWGEPRPGQPRLDWVIVGGESGPSARPMHPDWLRSLRDQCSAAGVPFFFKQWGEWIDERQATLQGCAPTPEMFNGDGQPEGDRWHFYNSADPLGGASIRIGRRAAGRLLDGREYSARPITWEPRTA